jgi:hypothetical protein
LKAAGEKHKITYISKHIRITADLSIKLKGPGEHGIMYFKP